MFNAKAIDALRSLAGQDASGGSVRAVLNRDYAESQKRCVAGGDSHAGSAATPFRQGEVFYTVVPHAEQPLDSYQAAYWSACFPVLFPYGDACDGLMRASPVSDSLWARSLLERADRTDYDVWRLHLGFVAVCYSTMHRRHILRNVRAKIRSGGFQKGMAKLLKVTAVDFGAIAEAIWGAWRCQGSVAE